jgi:hypothetical protein
MGFMYIARDIAILRRAEFSWSARTHGISRELSGLLLPHLSSTATGRVMLDTAPTPCLTMCSTALIFTAVAVGSP